MKNYVSICLVTVVFLSININQMFAAKMIDDIVLFKKGDWEVTLLRYDDRSSACVARIRDLRDFWKEFQIYTAPGVDELAFFYEYGDSNAKLKTFNFAIDKFPSWAYVDPIRDGDWLILDLNVNSEKIFRKIISQIRKGKELFHLDDDNKVINIFSLKGSNASMDALIDCHTKYF